MKRLMCIVAVGVMVVLATPVHASSFDDPDDMTSPLDVRKVTYHDKGGGVGSIKIVSDEAWDCEYFEPGLNSMFWLFDGKADGDVDLVGKVRCLKPSSGPRDLVLFLHGKETGNSYEPVPLKKPEDDSMRGTFSFDLPELKGRHLNFVVKVKDGTAEGCTAAHKCKERAPDSGNYLLY